VLPSDAQCRRAFASPSVATRARWDGRVFRGNPDEGSFCRPVCDAARATPPPIVEFYPSAAAAKAQGLVACQLCQPEYAPRCPDAVLENRAALAAVRRIERELGDADFDLNSVRTAEVEQGFAQHFGVGVDHYLRWQRLQLAKRLIDGTVWPLRDVALAAGFASSAQLSRAIHSGFGAAPSAVRKQRVRRDALAIRLPLRQPYDGSWVMDFLTKRSLPGLEEVRDGVYCRRVPSEQQSGGDWLEVRIAGNELLVCLPPSVAKTAAELLARVQHVFDAHADPLAIRRVLKADPWLAKSLTRAPGVRVPGAWDGFETAVRAILGQQVSVARARTLAIDLIARFGESGNFPTPQQLVEADVAAVGMPGKRGGAVRALAAAVLEAGLVLNDSAVPAKLFEQLCALPGIGPWTAGYVSMRVAGDADAFPNADWVVLKRLGMTAAVAQRHSLRWQPFRAYALMHIWRGLDLDGVAQSN